jgi:hypothetical protein
MSIVVKCTLPHARGTIVAGVSGVLYRVCPNTRQLCPNKGEVVCAGGCGEGVAKVDADRFALFDGYEVEHPAKPAPKPRAAKQRKDDNPPQTEAATELSPEIEVDQAPEFDVSVLDETVSALVEYLEAGLLDDNLDALLSAEVAGRNRKSAVAAFNARINRG